MFLIKNFQCLINIIIRQICGNRGELTAITGATDQCQQKKYTQELAQVTPSLVDSSYLQRSIPEISNGACCV
jgi:hypothetical protein